MHNTDGLKQRLTQHAHENVIDSALGRPVRAKGASFTCIYSGYIIKLHQPIVTDVRGVCSSVCLSRGSTRLHCGKTAERIKMLFGVNTPGDP